MTALMTKMMTKMAAARTEIRLALLAGMIAAFLASAGTAARAQNYNVSLDTSGLTAGDTYAVDYQLTTGDGTNPASVIDISNFVFGNGGAATGAATTTGTVTGSISAPPVTLDNTSGIPPEYTQGFDNGTGNNDTGSVSFNVDGSQLSAPANGTPDQFTFDLIDTTGGGSTPVATSGPNAFELFTLTNDPSTGGFTPEAYSYTDSTTNNQDFATFSALPATPELGAPITFGVLLALFGLGLARGRWAKAREQPPAPQ